ncbi:MAG: hypothetical protein ACRDIE_22475, partial [Chloroflexota bacterium]
MYNTQSVRGQGHRNGQFLDRRDWAARDRCASGCRLPDGAVFDLRACGVAKRLGETTVRMLAYNGSIPGPSLHVTQGSRIT